MQTTGSERERYWQAHLRACRASGQSLKAYAEAQGLNLGQLYQWNHRLKRTPALVPVQIRDLAHDADPGCCRVVLPSGLTLDWPITAEPARLRGLIDALERP